MFFRKTDSKGDDLYIICGLGNPGLNYERTRHNCGFMVLDKLAEKYKGVWKGSRLDGDTCRLVIAGKKVLLLKPSTYMNLSGVALGKAVRYYRTPLKNTLVIYDDIDIDLSKVRIREKGGAGSHNGMKSILEHLKAQDFPRVRVGIGPQNRQIDIVDFVLAAFPPESAPALQEGLDRAVAAVECYLENDIQYAMNRFNKN